MTLIDPATAKWLVSEYGVSQSAAGGANRFSRPKACLGGPSLQVWKEDRRQRILPACQDLPIGGHGITQSPNRASKPNCRSQGALEASVNSEFNVRIGIPAPVLESGVRTWQF